MTPLSPRELQVLALMADGLTNAEIGAVLYLSENTIKVHARRLYAKLGARNRQHATALGVHRGLVAMPGRAA